MARNELDPARKKAAVDVVKQHPGMVASLAAPGVIAVVVVWVLAGSGWGLLLLVALGVLGAVGLSKLLRAR